MLNQVTSIIHEGLLMNYVLKSKNTKTNPQAVMKMFDLLSIFMCSQIQGHVIIDWKKLFKISPDKACKMLSVLHNRAINLDWYKEIVADYHNQSNLRKCSNLEM